MELGVPTELTVDGSKEKKIPGTELMKCFGGNDTSLTKTNTERPNQNTAEGLIREVRR